MQNSYKILLAAGMGAVFGAYLIPCLPYNNRPCPIGAVISAAYSTVLAYLILHV